MTAKTQILLLVDLQGSVAVDELQSLLPDGSAARQVRRLTEFGARPLQAPPTEVTPVEWELLGKAVSAMAEWFHDAARGEEVALYVGGQGPLPVFTHLGQALSRFSGEQHFISRRYGGAWELLPISDGPNVGETLLLDVRVGFPQSPSPGAGAVALYLDTGGRPEPTAEIVEAVSAMGAWLSGTVVLRSSEPLTLTPENTAGIAREVVRALARAPSLHPFAEVWALFVAGPSTFAFIVGRALNPNVFPAVWLTNHRPSRYALVYDLPERKRRMPRAHLTRVEVEGFRAFGQASLDLGAVNVLIGPNGAGKSSLVDLFDMLRGLATGRLRDWVARHGSSHAILHFGPKRSPKLRVRVSMQSSRATDRYEVTLSPTHDERLLIEEERVILSRAGGESPWALDSGDGRFESALHDAAPRDPVAAGFRWLLRDCRVFHVHDTSSLAGIRGSCDVTDGGALHRDASNLAAVLLRLSREHPKHYRRIVTTLQKVLPFLDDFALAERGDRPRVRLDWRHRHQPVDYVLGPHQLSDGSLRVIALYTLLLLPDDERPRVIVLDEPELGLHPAAVTLLASLIRMASQRTQCVLATQSTLLLDQFEPGDVIVIESHDGASDFRRPDEAALRKWQRDFEYSVSDQWEMNLFGGVP